MGGNTGSFREFVVGGLRLFGGLFAFAGLMFFAFTVFAFFQYFMTSAVPSTESPSFSLNGKPVTALKFISTLTLISTCLLVFGVLLIRFSFSKLMDVLED